MNVDLWWVQESIQIYVFSFHPVKIIAGGEGGMITTNSEDLYNKLLKLRTHGVNQNPNEILIKMLGFQKIKKIYGIMK